MRCSCNRQVRKEKAIKISEISTRLKNRTQRKRLWIVNPRSQGRRPMMQMCSFAWITNVDSYVKNEPTAQHSDIVHKIRGRKKQEKEGLNNSECRGWIHSDRWILVQQKMSTPDEVSNFTCDTRVLPPASHEWAQISSSTQTKIKARNPSDSKPPRPQRSLHDTNFQEPREAARIHGSPFRSERSFANEI